MRAPNPAPGAGRRYAAPLRRQPLGGDRDVEFVTDTFETPFQDVVAKYAMGFAQPVFFGDSPAQAYSAQLFNGTASLLRLGERYLAVTCAHVLEGFRSERARSAATIFQIGRQSLDPEPFLASESSALDLAVLDVSPLVRDGGDLEPANFSVALQWPPGDLVETDILAFAGFPGVWRDQLALGYLRFYAVTVVPPMSQVSRRSTSTLGSTSVRASA